MKDTRMARYVLANSFVASASVNFVNRTGISSFKAPSANTFAKRLALSDCSPTMILDGYKLSYKALPSLRNSGENMMLSVSNFSLTDFVYLTGMVDLITMTASGLMDYIFSITVSTLLVSV